ncbi:MAG: biopolymer transporter ExbD [Opitutales bacterium]|nr:biopolymer transporter ExbD [Opitutales bacterium]
MLSRNSSDSDDDDVSIDLSPMIDCVFILLIFFIVTTVFVEEAGIEVNRPDARSSGRLEKNSILIAISPENKVVYGGRDIGVQGVRNVVRGLVMQDDLPVIIQADKESNHGIFRQVYMEARLAGAKKISFSTFR